MTIHGDLRYPVRREPGLPEPRGYKLLDVVSLGLMAVLLPFGLLALALMWSERLWKRLRRGP